MSDRHVVDQWVQATCRADPQALSRLLAPDAVMIDEPSGARFIGPRGYLESVSVWGEALSMQVSLNTVREEGAGVWEVSFAVQLTHVGVFRSGRWGDAPPTGRQFSITINERLTVRNGRVTELRVIYNLLALLREVGLRA